MHLFIGDIKIFTRNNKRIQNYADLTKQSEVYKNNAILFRLGSMERENTCFIELKDFCTYVNMVKIDGMNDNGSILRDYLLPPDTSTIGNLFVDIFSLKPYHLICDHEVEDPMITACQNHLKKKSMN